MQDQDLRAAVAAADAGAEAVVQTAAKRAKAAAARRATQRMTDEDMSGTARIFYIDPKDFTSINAGAELAGVTRRTIYNWLNAGKIDQFRTPGGAPRLLKSQLLQLIPYRPRVPVGLSPDSPAK